MIKKFKFDFGKITKINGKVTSEYVVSDDLTK